MIESLFGSTNYQATKKLLDVAAARHEALASNIANIETPGYKRLDLTKSFNDELNRQLRSGHAEGINALQPKIEADPNAPTTRADGNNVQLDRELLAIASNSTNYEVLSQFASSSLKHLRTAITGRIA